MSIHLELGDAHVEPCPFCGVRDLDLRNTHTACYWIECLRCGAEVSGKAFGGGRPSDKLTKTHHERARRSALMAWNLRKGVGDEVWRWLARIARDRKVTPKQMLRHLVAAELLRIKEESGRRTARKVPTR